MNVQWYPGHMTRAKRMMQEDIGLIDLVIELLDARVPYSSRNPDIDELAKNKSRLILLNKNDLADPSANDAWQRFYTGKGFLTAQINSQRGAGMRQIQPLIEEACREKTERDRKRGILNRPVRVMVCGIPNVGKSTFINTFAGKAAAKTGNKPGVTRGKQWIHLGKSVELLDTPGILWPKIEDPLSGVRLALIGSVKDELMQPEQLSGELLSFLVQQYPGVLSGRYSIEESESADQMLEDIALRLGCIRREGEKDLPRAARMLIDDFRKGKLGKISLEFPPSYR